MAEFLKTSTTWVVDFRYDGRPRRWFRAFRPDVNVREAMEAELHDLYGERVKLEEVRPATNDEESAYLRGEQPKNLFCPMPVERNLD